MMRVYDTEKSIYRQLRALDWRRYLCAMWIICGEIRALYVDWLTDSERSLMAATLDTIRATVISGGVTAATSDDLKTLAQRWEALMDEREGQGAWSWDAWVVFSDLVGELLGGERYEATETLYLAATSWWVLSHTPANRGIWINNPNEEVADDSPLAQALNRMLAIGTAIAQIPESDCDPVKVRTQIFG